MGLLPLGGPAMRPTTFLRKEGSFLKKIETSMSVSAAASRWILGSSTAHSVSAATANSRRMLFSSELTRVLLALPCLWNPWTP